MPSELRDHQHELMAEDESFSFVFGTEDTGYLTLTPPSYSTTGTREGDVERHREDSVALGEDYLSGKTSTYEVAVLQDRAPNPQRAGSDALGRIEQVWRSPRFRRSSAAYAVMRTCEGGRVTRAYGRPRRYEETTGAMTRRGITPVVCDFFSQDGRWYDDETSQVSASLVPPTDGGLTSPLVSPLTTTATSERQAVLEVAGTSETWPVVRFHAPSGCTAPKLQIGDDLVVGLTGTIPANSVITVDPRPWVRQATRQDGGNYAGRLSYETPPMRKMLVDPGRYTLRFSATDLTGTAWAEVEWRNAYPRP